MEEIKNVVFFARDYQADLFTKLCSPYYNSIYITFLKREKDYLIKKGFDVASCFEEEFDLLDPNIVPESYFETSFVTDRFLGKFDLFQRRKFLSKEITYWSRILDLYKPIAVVNEIVAIEMSEVMYIEAKKRQIKYLAWMVSPFDKKCFYWLTIPYHAQLDDLIFKKSIKETSNAQEYLLKFNEQSNYKPFYARDLDSRFNVYNIIKALCGFFYMLMRSILIKRKDYFRLFYENSETHFDKIKCFFNSIIFHYKRLPNDFEIVFYPLHFEPEASILYMSEYNENQAALIRNLCKCLKNNQVLVVKEHPQQPGVLLTKKYRKLASEISNLWYLPAESSTKELIKKSKLIITQTSTAGWEAILLGKPVFVLGKVFYDKHPDVNLFFGFENLKSSIHGNLYKTPSFENTLIFVQQFWNYCELGNPFPTNYLYTEENIKNLKCAIENKLYYN